MADIRDTPWTASNNPSVERTDLSFQNIAEDIGVPVNTALDLIGLGTVLGITTGVGDGNRVDLPEDFWGESINFTLSNGSLSTVSQFPNTESQRNLTIYGSGLGRLATPNWVSPEKVLITAQETITLIAQDNSTFGRANRSGTIYLYGSNQNTAQASTSVSQLGNPASLNASVSSLSYSYNTTSRSFTINPTSNITTITVTTSNSHLTATKNGNTITVTRSVDYGLTDRNINVIVTCSNSGGQSFDEIIPTTIDKYNQQTLTGFVNFQHNASPPGETKNATLTGESGGSALVESDVAWIQFSNSTPNTGDTIVVTFTANNGSSTRNGTITVTDGLSAQSHDIDVQQLPQPLSTWSVSPTSLTWDWDDTSTKQVTINITARSGYNANITTRDTLPNYMYQHFQHSFTNSNFSEINVNKTATGNQTLYIKPTGTNTSYTFEYSINSAYYNYGVRSSDYYGGNYGTIYDDEITLVHKPKTLDIFWKFMNVGGVARGETSTYPIGASGDGHIRVYSASNASDIEIDLEIYGGMNFIGWSQSSFSGTPGSLPASNITPTWSNNPEPGTSTDYPYVEDFYIIWTGSSSATCTYSSSSSCRLYISDDNYVVTGTGTKYIAAGQTSTTGQDYIHVCQGM